jgi:hypothetical protein
MSLSLFETLGKYGGLAGIGVGVVLVIFRQMLKLHIFSQLVSGQTYRLLQQLMYLTFATGTIGIMAWVFVTKDENVSRAITGHVVDGESRRPVSDAEVTLSGRPESTRTDGAGNFSLSLVTALPGGSTHLFIAKAGYAMFDRNASAGQNVEAELSPDGAPENTRETVIDADPGTQKIVRDVNDGIARATLVHVCPTGFAMTGADVDGNTFKCMRVADVSKLQEMRDVDTTRTFGNANVHVCPGGWYMRGLHDGYHWLLCANGAVLDTTFMDTSGATGEGIRQCPADNGRQSVMVGIARNKSDFACAYIRH